MRLYNLIQAKIFDTYEEWQMRTSLFNCDGFHIVGVDNYLKAMRDGYNMFVEIRPPHAVGGCTSMKAVGGKNADGVDLLLTIDGEKYLRMGLSYDDAAQIMKAFVQKRALPDIRAYEPWIDDPKKLTDAFGALAEILLGDAECARRLCRKLRRGDEEAIEAAWNALYQVLVQRGRAVELDRKSDKETFAAAVQTLSAGTGLVLDETLLDETDYISHWCGGLNALWNDHVLAAMDMGGDSYVLLVLTRADYVRAAECARVLLHRIAPAEEI